MRFDESDADTPQLDEVDTLEVPTQAKVFNLGDDDVGQLLEAVVEAMGGVGPDAEERYQQALEPVRSDPEGVVRLLESAQGIRSIAEDQYVTRWSLAQLLGELQHPAARGPLEEILDAPVPAERSDDPHSFSTIGEELMIRTTAVDGLERLAGQGDAAAVDALWNHVDDEHLSIRRACVQAIVAVGDDDQVERLRRHLADRDETWLLDVRRTDVRAVPQAEGGLFLLPRDVRDVDRYREVPPLEDDPELPGVLIRARRLAAHILGVAEDEIVRLPDGRYAARDAPERALTFGQLAEAASDPRRLPEGMEPDLWQGGESAEIAEEDD